MISHASEIGYIAHVGGMMRSNGGGIYMPEGFNDEGSIVLKFTMEFMSISA